MTIQELQTICRKFPGATEDIKWGEHLCFNVGTKMFLITAPDQVPPSASFKVSEEDFEELSSKDGFKPAPHLARYKWIYTEDIGLLSKKQWEYYISNSYKLVASKLPKKIQQEIGLIE